LLEIWVLSGDAAALHDARRKLNLISSMAAMRQATGSAVAAGSLP